MKNILIILILLLPLPLLSQSGDLLKNNPEIPVFNGNYLKNNLLLKDTSVRKNLFCIDPDFLAISMAYLRKIKQRDWYIGVGCGGGINFLSIGISYYLFGASGATGAWDLKNKWGKANVSEFFHLEIICKNVYSENINFDYGLRVAYGFVQDADMYEASAAIPVGIYFSPLFGGKHFKIGPRINLTFNYFKIIYIYPLLFRYNF